jgi:hypothetical protein
MSEPAQSAKTPKHVIFLGAGASRTSGYPLADDLRRLWLASTAGLQQQVGERMPNQNISQNQNSQAAIATWLKPIEHSLQFFREGCFGTIDEFCYLIRKSEATDVKQLKKVMRLVFGLHDPEAAFHNGASQLINTSANA